MHQRKHCHAGCGDFCALVHSGAGPRRARCAAAAIALALWCVASSAYARGSATLDVSYLWNLSTETGPIRTSSWALTFDPAAREVFVTGENTIRIFNATGMEVFSFVPDPDVGFVYSTAALENGDLLLLAHRGTSWSIQRASFRGEAMGPMELKGVPRELLREFSPGVVAVRSGQVYLADLTAMRMLVVDEEGAFVRSHDVAALLGFDAQKRADTGMNGFGVDVDGGVLFTIAPLFTAYALSPQGELRSWGRPGGRPGDFDVVAGIAADANHYYVVDNRKSAVVVFARADLSFEHEFGYRTSAAGGLVSPTAIAASGERVYVSQNASRGVSVYAVRDRPQTM